MIKVVFYSRGYVFKIDFYIIKVTVSQQSFLSFKCGSKIRATVEKISVRWRSEFHYNINSIRFSLKLNDRQIEFINMFE